MFGIVFSIEARPGKHQELLEFLRWDGEVCRDREPGTLRFEFYVMHQVKMPAKHDPCIT